MFQVALLFAGLFMAAFVGAAQTQTKGQPPPSRTPGLDKPALEEFVRHLFVWGPQIQVKVNDPKPSDLPGFQQVSVVASAGQASQEETFYVSNDGKKIVRGTVFDVGRNPFQSDVDKIKTDLQPSFGTAGAPVVVVVYSDFQCSFCKEEAKVIRQELTTAFAKEVRVYFKDFPLEAIHPWAKPAAIAGRCVFRQKPAAFWDYHDWIFDKQGEITGENLKSKVIEWAGTKSLEPVQLGTCIDNRTTEAEVNRSMAEARMLGINSTPTVFVNGRKLVGQVPWQNLKQIIEHEIEYQKKHGGGEKCCEVTLQNPAAK